MSTPMIEMLLRRRSVKPAEMVKGAPGPDAGQLQMILTAAARVPDHKKLVPWRFIVVEGEGRQRLGTVLADALIAEDRELAVGLPARQRAQAAARRAVDHRRCLTRDAGSAGGARVGANPVGGSCVFQPLPRGQRARLCDQLADGVVCVQPPCAEGDGLSDGERFAGFIYVGHAATVPEDRERPDLAQVVSRF